MSYSRIILLSFMLSFMDYGLYMSVANSATSDDSSMSNKNMIKPFDPSVPRASNSENIANQVQNSLLFSSENNKDFVKNYNKSVGESGKISIQKKELVKDNKIDMSVIDNNSGEEIYKLKKLAYNADKNGQYEIALQIYKDIALLDKDDEYTKFSIAAMYQKLRQYDQATPIYLSLLEYNPGDERIISNLLSIMVEDDPSKAAVLLEKLINTNPRKDYIFSKLSASYQKAGDYKKALYYSKKALEIDSENPEYQLDLGIVFDKLTNYDSAIYYYNKFLSNPLNVNMYKMTTQIKSRRDYISKL